MPEHYLEPTVQDLLPKVLAWRDDAVREGIKAFVRRVDARAEHDLLVNGSPLEGAHNRAIRAELALLESEKS